MRESTLWTTKYQFANIFLAHLEAIGISFVFLAAAFYLLMTKYIFREILSVIFMTVYFGVVYSRAHKFATLDKKPYTKTRPSLLKSIMFGLMLSFSFFVVWGIYKLMWINFGQEGMLSSVGAGIYSIFFWIYTIPFNGIMGLAKGHIMWYALLSMFLVPVLATTLGYWAGLKNFRLMDKIGNLAYEKED